MLLLGRKVGEKVHLGGDVVVTVVQVCGDKVRLGITCPRDVPIYRQEVLPAGHPAAGGEPRPDGATA